MRDQFPFFRIFTIPTGAGPNDARIVINGITGQIEVYDANGDLVGLWSSTQFSIDNGPAGSGRIVIIPNATSNNPGIFFDPATTALADYVSGLIFADTLNADDTPYLGIISPRLPTGTASRIDLYGENPTGAFVVPVIQLAPNAGGGVDGYVNIVDGGTNGDLKIDQHTIGRGIVVNGVFETTGNDVARAAGVNTDATITASFLSSRRYRANLNSQFTGGTAGAIYALDILEDGVQVGRMDRVDLEAGATVGFFTSHYLYTPTSDGAHTITLRNNAGSGGTLQLTAGGGQPRQFWLEDVGAP